MFNDLIGNNNVIIIVSFKTIQMYPIRNCPREVRNIINPFLTPFFYVNATKKSNELAIVTATSKSQLSLIRIKLHSQYPEVHTTVTFPECGKTSSKPPELKEVLRCLGALLACNKFLITPGSTTVSLLSKKI